MNESILLDGGGMRIGFHWHRDRVAHTVGVLDGPRLDPFLASREGTPDELWPASPPFQEVHVEQHEGRQVALLVGRAGQCHWSGSVEIDPEAAAVHFDIACRLKGAMVRRSENDDLLPIARSAYQSMMTPTCDGEGTVRVANGCAVLAIASVAVEDRSAPATMAVADSGFQIWIPPSIDPQPGTLRWRYTISRFE